MPAKKIADPHTSHNITEYLELIITASQNGPRFTLHDHIGGNLGQVDLTPAELLRIHDIANDYIAPAHVGDL